MRISSSGVAVLALFVAALSVRIAVLGVDGHNGDVYIMSLWAERMVDVGPWRFYENSGSIYPALLYPLWALGAAFDGPALDLAIKSLSIPFDLALGGLLYWFMSRQAGSGIALAVTALYLLNPAVLLAGPIWGQVDAAGTLPFLAALIACAARRDGLAGILAVAATLVKPQFGLVVLPVLTYAIVRSYRARDWGPILRSVGGMALAMLIIGGPLGLHPLRWLGLFLDTAGYAPYVSLYAFNPWGLVIGFGDRFPDDQYVLLGTALLVLGLTEVMVGLRRGQDVANLIAVGAMLVIAFYFLPTRVHERYLFPAMALLVPFALVGAAHLAAYLAISAGFAASLLYTLHEITPFNLPEPIAAAFVSPGGVWTIGLVSIGAALAWGWLLLVRRPRLPTGPGNDHAASAAPAA